ncbi:hypothetical protein SAMN05421493_10627 [Pseudobutyrivibrio sp. 49]|uniref:hypothetical protein n=1 Tax=unclassified Pseudobutyrivibrio TaxID=2638619 RepID=UPI0008893B3A|nr:MULTISPECIES: hypothetical protein [unclassified Pseudobutyrivibrio]SDH95753.1 hypothetical protein SAMN05421493_10627 [Pseudobutyrivibrio sp. 49]SFN86233.1 hypothetical protein SAMN04487831_104138 [Pseudobutyrivibrio sp. UC1225]
MKFFGIKENIFALLLTVIIAVGGAGVITAHAAGHIDTDATVTITAQVGKEDTSVFAQSYNGKVDINLYKIATLDEAGLPVLSPSYKNSGIDLSVLANNPKVADIEKNIVEPAVKAAGSQQADAVITASRQNNIFSGTATIDKGVGIYLYVPQPVSDEKYKYSFTSYVIYAPSSDFIVTGAADADKTWKYNVSFIIKPQETPIEVNIPDEPTPTHGDDDDVVGFGEDIIEMGSQVPLYGRSPKTGDSVLPIIFCGIAFIIGMAFILWYFRMASDNKKNNTK